MEVPVLQVQNTREVSHGCKRSRCVQFFSWTQKLFSMSMSEHPQRTPLCSEFLGWQCRIRQHAVRKQEGRPADGIRASVKIDGEFVGQIYTIINKQDSEEIIKEFRFMVQKTVDPKQRYENALKYLCEYHYQYPAEFSERMTALFALDSETAHRLIASDHCELTFFQANQRYVLHARAVLCDAESSDYQATYWHNHLFNPNLPGMVKIIGFNIDWQNSASEQVSC